MIQFFQKYKGICLIVIALTSLSMLGFGIDFGGGSQSNYAIKVDDIEVSHQEFYQRKRELQERYRRMLGDNYFKIAPELFKNLNQNLIDSTIEHVLLEREARRNNLFLGDDEVKRMIRTELFPGGFNREQYLAMLRQLGLTSEQFQKQLAVDALIEEYRGLIGDTSRVSELEARSLLEVEESSYDVSYVAVKPEDFISKVADPGQEELEQYFERNASEYESTARAAYDYVVFDPQGSLDMVEVPTEDIEFYYTENLRRFTLPDKIKARHIRLDFPKDASTDRVEEIKTLAEELHAKVQAGEDFTTLAEQYSEDLETKFKGGDLGWFSRGEQEKKLEAAVFAMRQGGLTEPLATESGYHIIQVDDYQPSTPRDLEEVRGEIEKKIREREAPAYASAMAQDFHSKWLSAGLSLKEFAKSNGKEAISNPDLLDKRQDPEGMRGLSVKVLSSPEQVHQLVELRHQSLVVEVTNYRSAEIPPLEEIKDNIVADYKAEAAKKLAEEKTQELLVLLKEGEVKDLRKAAKTFKLKVEEQKELKAGRGTSGIFAHPILQRALFSSSRLMTVPKNYHLVDGVYYLAQLEKVNMPEEKDLQEKMDNYRQQASMTIAGETIRSIVNRLKARAEIDINPGLLTE